ncbi:MAG TPA: hypothetical protein VMJ10_21195 [Kofleriaceae bacterium]|nr:hypothetical protein [Kofleriaceae bacterium]
MSKLWLVLALTAGCTAEVAITGDSAEDSEADGDDPAEIEQIAALVAAEPAPPAGGEQADVAKADRDGDGIPDATEELLLRRYRPFYRFSQANGAEETYRPADPVAELENAQLRISYPDADGTSDPIAGCGRAGDAHLEPPDQLYTCAPDASFAVAHAKTDYSLNLDNTRYHGVDFSEAEANATGLYGHVAPTTIDGHDAYKIEYWQFFAFNNQDITILGLGSFGDHEGDWTSVQLWFDRIEHRIVRVRYLIHGKQALFDVAPNDPSCSECTIAMKGAAYDPDPPNFFDDEHAYSNNQAQFYIDAHKFKHPVVYIERGAHEFWPGPWGHASIHVSFFNFALNPHNGDGPDYLVPAVPGRLFNMGEVAHPLTHDAAIILPFDGFWGSTNTHEAGFWGPVRRSPVGPALHCEWRWPDGSAVSGCEN